MVILLSACTLGTAVTPRQKVSEFLDKYKNENTDIISQLEETISSDKYISAIDGRSSIGRLGISIHSTAGFGDIGFSGTYTLEISVVQPVIIYPDMLIGQVYFTEPNGDIDFLYSGRYQNQSGAVESRINIDSKDISNYHYNKNT